MMMARVRRVGIYVRISDDREGAGLGVKRQEEDCRALAERLGWRVVEVYNDNDLSAYSKKAKRVDYERMLADVRNEHIDAIVSWHTDRLHRSPKELESFIDLVDEFQVEIETVRGGKLDLKTASGRMMARQFGNYARYESEIKSERILRKVDQLVADGKVHNGGNRPYGFTRLYEGEGPRRKILGDIVNEEEAARIRDWAKRALEGDDLRAIVKDINNAGLLTSTGRPWTIQALRFLLISGRIAGLKEHRREIVGKAAWDAIITVEEHRLLRARLKDPKRHSGGGRTRKYPYTGLVRCSCRDEPGMDEDVRVKALMKMGPRKRPRMTATKARVEDMQYACKAKAEGGCGGRVIKMVDLGDHIRDLILAHLEQVEAAPIDDDAERATLENKLLKYEQRLQDLKEEFAEGDQSPREFRETVALINGKIAEVETELATKGIKRRIEANAAELRAGWEDLPMERKRSVARNLIEMIVIHPAVQPYSVFSPGRIEVVWK